MSTINIQHPLAELQPVGETGKKKDFCSDVRQNFLATTSGCAEAEMESPDGMSVGHVVGLRRPQKLLLLLGS